MCALGCFGFEVNKADVNVWFSIRVNFSFVGLSVVVVVFNVVLYIAVVVGLIVVLVVVFVIPIVVLAVVVEL